MKQRQPNLHRSSRRLARELALQGIYAWLLDADQEYLSRDDLINVVRDEQGLEVYEQADQELLNNLLIGVTTHSEVLRKQFAPYIDRAVEELSPVEHGILLLATYEMVYSLDVPYRVVINEAVELAKEFGGTDGFKFINGVLDKLAGQVRQIEMGA